MLGITRDCQDAHHHKRSDSKSCHQSSFHVSSPHFIYAAPLQAAQMYRTEKISTLKKRNLNFFCFLVSVFANFIVIVRKITIDFGQQCIKKFTVRSQSLRPHRYLT
jgi:hypothetical protein